MPIQTSSSKPDPTISHQAALSDEASLTDIATAIPRELDNPAVRSYMDELAFMNEEVEVMFSPPYDPNDTALLVTLSINGRDEHFIKGEWKKVKRCYLENAAMARRESWTFSYKQGRDGQTVQTEFASQNQRFPFQVRDLNPKGQAWLQQLLGRPV
jgi:hypothetical protein